MDKSDEIWKITVKNNRQNIKIFKKSEKKTAPN